MLEETKFEMNKLEKININIYCMEKISNFKLLKAGIGTRILRKNIDIIRLLFMLLHIKIIISK